MKSLEQKIIVRCKNCGWRIFDKVTMTTGVIELKCPNCHRVVEVDLSLRKGTVKYVLLILLYREENMKMSENNDYIQLPPLKKDTPSDVVAFIWEYMKVPENSREKVKNLLKDANENGVKLSHQAPTLYDVVPKEEIAEFEELMRKTIADIVSEASSIACWVYVQKYVKQKTLDEMLQELPGAGQFIIVMDTWFERLMAE